MMDELNPENSMGGGIMNPFTQAIQSINLRQDANESLKNATDQYEADVADFKNTQANDFEQGLATLLDEIDPRALRERGEPIMGKYVPGGGGIDYGGGEGPPLLPIAPPMDDRRIIREPITGGTRDIRDLPISIGGVGGGADLDRSISPTIRPPEPRERLTPPVSGPTRDIRDLPISIGRVGSGTPIDGIVAGGTAGFYDTDPIDMGDFDRNLFSGPIDDPFDDPFPPIILPPPEGITPPIDGLPFPPIDGLPGSPGYFDQFPGILPPGSGNPYEGIFGPPLTPPNPPPGGPSDPPDFGIFPPFPPLDPPQDPPQDPPMDPPMDPPQNPPTDFVPSPINPYTGKPVNNPYQPYSTDSGAAPLNRAITPREFGRAPGMFTPGGPPLDPIPAPPPKPPIDPPIMCFVAGTKVDMADGTKKVIENIAIGDEVLALNGETDVVSYVHDIPKAERNLWTINDKITATDAHAFLTKDGWKSNNARLSNTVYNDYGIDVKTLKVGDKLITKDGVEEVTKLESEKDFVKVYNFTTSNTHTYMVDGVVSHNKLPPKPPMPGPGPGPIPLPPMVGPGKGINPPPPPMMVPGGTPGFYDTDPVEIPEEFLKRFQESRPVKALKGGGGISMLPMNGQGDTLTTQVFQAGFRPRR